MLRPSTVTLMACCSLLACSLIIEPPPEYQAFEGGER